MEPKMVKADGGRRVMQAIPQIAGGRLAHDHLLLCCSHREESYFSLNYLPLMIKGL